jgi:hypothetical protein
MNDLSHSGPHFTELMEVLLQGQAICEHRFPQLHRVLVDGEDGGDNEDAHDRANAEAILETMGRRLAHEADTYYAVYTGYDDTVEAAFRARFERYYREAKPLCEFLDIVRESTPGQVWPEPGDRFAFSVILESVIASTRLNDQLMEAVNSVSQSVAATPDVALRTLVRRLTEYGYIVATDTQSQHYVMTGELALFKKWQDFVAEIEDIDLDSDAAVNEEGGDQAELL